MSKASLYESLSWGSYQVTDLVSPPPSVAGLLGAGSLREIEPSPFPWKTLCKRNIIDICCEFYAENSDKLLVELIILSCVLYLRLQYWPAQNTENEVHDEECAKHYHGHEVHELPGAALRVMDLKTKKIIAMKQSGPRCTIRTNSKLFRQ